MRLFLILIIFLFGTLHSYSQTENWINFSKNTSARCIFNDDNFIWIGSGHGLLKYDKSMDTSYLYNASNSGLPENTVKAICKDQQGAIWVGTLYEGLVKFEDDTWEEIDIVNEYLSGSYITDIFIDANDVKWITSHNGLLKLDSSGLTVYNESNSNIPNDQLNSVLKDNYGNMWFGTSGLIKYSGNEWEMFSSQDTNLPLGAYYTIEYGNNDDLWSICGAHLIKIDSISFSTFTSQINNLHYLAVDQSDTIFVACHNGEFAFQKYYNDSWYTYNSNNSGITNSNVRQVMVDIDNTKWFVGDDGLDKLSYSNTWHFSNLSNSKLPSNYIKSIATGGNGVTYVCTNSGVVGYNWNNWSDLIISDRSDHICFDNYNNLLIANPYNVYIYDDSQIETLDTPFIGSSIDIVKKIIVDMNNNIWMTFPNDYYNYMKGGVFMYDGNTWTTFNESNSGLPHSNISDIAIDNENNTWFATSGGVAMFNNDNWTLYDKDNSPLPYNSIFSIMVDLLNNIWVSMPYQTIACFDGDNWIVYDSPINPRAGKLYDLSIDSEGNIWGVGINKVAKFDLTNWEYFDRDNSPIPHNNTKCLTIDQNDNVFIGTSINGVYIFNENGINPVLTGTNESIETEPYYIYPNPSTGIINIELVYDFRNHTVLFKVFNISGVNIYSSQKHGNSHYAIDLSNHSKGVYILQIETNNNITTKKIIIN